MARNLSKDPEVTICNDSEWKRKSKEKPKARVTVANVERDFDKICVDNKEEVAPKKKSSADSSKAADATTTHHGTSVTRGMLDSDFTVKRGGPTAASSGIFGSTASSQFELVPPPEDLAHYTDTKTRIELSHPDRDFGWLRKIDEAEVREALRNEVRKHKYWKKIGVEKMVLSNIKCYTSLHYSLETFTEQRSTTAGSEPYSVGQYLQKGGFNDQSRFSAGIWELPCEPRNEFTEDTRMFEIPGTSDLTACSSCGAEGVSHCFHCRGSGSDSCKYCRGTGMKAGIPHPAVYTHPMVGASAASLGAGAYGPQRQPYQARLRHNGGGIQTGQRRGVIGGFGAHNHQPGFAQGTPVHYMNVSGVPPPGIGSHDLCFFCHGSGVQGCTHCNGTGKKTCSSCGGSGSMRTFLKLRVKYVVERSDYFHHEGEVPEDKLREVTGEVVFAESKPYVVPLKAYPVEDVNDNSRRLCQIHLQKSIGVSKILQQRHLLEAIPVAEVDYELGGKTGKFWVYGQERLCYVPKYPTKCSIL